MSEGIVKRKHNIGLFSGEPSRGDNSMFTPASGLNAYNYLLASGSAFRDSYGRALLYGEVPDNWGQLIRKGSTVFQASANHWAVFLLEYNPHVVCLWPDYEQKLLPGWTPLAR